jgi:hypothetical protein
MLPIYVCGFKQEWAIQLEEPVDYSKPLTQDEITEMLDFLSQFSAEPNLAPQEIETDSPAAEGAVEEDWADDEAFFEDPEDGEMFTPATMGEE